MEQEGNREVIAWSDLVLTVQVKGPEVDRILERPGTWVRKAYSTLEL